MIVFYRVVDWSRKKKKKKKKRSRYYTLTQALCKCVQKETSDFRPKLFIASNTINTAVNRLIVGFTRTSLPPSPPVFSQSHCSGQAFLLHPFIAVHISRASKIITPLYQKAGVCVKPHKHNSAASHSTIPNLCQFNSMLCSTGSFSLPLGKHVNQLPKASKLCTRK